MPLDAFKNLAYSTVATAPAPADSGTSLVVTAGQGTRFPTAPFNATVWPADTVPTPANAEIVRVTAITTDTLTITRAQEGTTARSILVGDRIAATITALTLSTLETDISTALSVGNAASNAASVVSNAVSNEISNRVSADNALSQAISVLSQAVSVADAALSVRIDTQSQGISVLSAAVSVISQQVSTLSQGLSALSAKVDGASVKSVGGTSVKGFQSVLNALSNRISAVPGGSGSATPTSAQFNTVSNQVSVLSLRVYSSQLTGAVSVSGVVSTLSTYSTRMSAISAQAASAISQEASVRSAADAVMSANIVSLQSTVSHLASAVSLVSAVSGGGTAVGLQSVINALSNRISAIPGGGSTNVVGLVTTSQVVSAYAAISGLCVSISAGKTYRLEGMVMYNAGTTSVPRKFGLSATQAVGAGRWRGQFRGPLSSFDLGVGPVSAGQMFGIWNGVVAGGLTVISVVPPAPVSSIAFLSSHVFVEGVIHSAASSGVVILHAGASAGLALTILEGSYVRVFKLN